MSAEIYHGIVNDFLHFPCNETVVKLLNQILANNPEYVDYIHKTPQVKNDIESLRNNTCDFLTKWEIMASLIVGMQIPPVQIRFDQDETLFQNLASLMYYIRILEDFLIAETMKRISLEKETNKVVN